jgi:hypothetical protein
MIKNTLFSFRALIFSTVLLSGLTVQSMQALQLQQALLELEPVNNNPNASIKFEDIAILIQHYKTEKILKNTVAVRGIINFENILHKAKNLPVPTVIVLQINPNKEHINIVYIHKKDVIIFEPVGVSDEKGFSFIEETITVLKKVFLKQQLSLYVNNDIVQYAKTGCNFTSLLFAIKIEEDIDNFFPKWLEKAKEINEENYYSFDLLTAKQDKCLNYLPIGSLDPNIKCFTQSLKDIQNYKRAREVNNNFTDFIKIFKTLNIQKKRFENSALDLVIKAIFQPIIKIKRANKEEVNEQIKNAQDYYSLQIYELF